MRKLFELLKETMENGKDAVLVTVVASSGSTPRGAGARMLVTANGRERGTIGGGAVEFQCERFAADVLKEKKSRAACYRLHKNEIHDLGMVCGGDVDVYFQYIAAGDAYFVRLAEKIEEMYATNERSWLISDITPGIEGGIGVYGKKSGLFGLDAPREIIGGLCKKAVLLEANGRTYYCEELVQAGIVYIFGGGHVSQALVPALAAVGFRCVVLEDRQEFCRPELFAGFAQTRIIDNNIIKNSVEIGADDFVVIMTRGHKDDQTVLAQTLKTPARYIGVIGSRSKSAQMFANLRDEGFSDNDLKRVTTPIGLDIGAETPAEIAVSIAAQLIRERARLFPPSGDCATHSSV